MLWQAYTLGSTAHSSIRCDGTFSLLGTTSRGVFLRNTITGQILFLCGETYHGPLTINLDPSFTGTRLNPEETEAFLEGKIFSFPLSQTQISMAKAGIWDPPLPPEKLMSLSEQHIYQQDVGAKLVDLMVSNGREQVNPVDWDIPVTNLSESIDRLESILGRGPGLTPFGDDLVASFLLTLNRMSNTLYPGIQIEPINNRLVKAAKWKTTSLSANLIECAASGQADERLILALDGLLGGNLDPDTCAEYLYKYGCSSGWASFLGMQRAISYRNDKQTA